MENLTIIRKESHATQQEVADYLGISRQAYGNYESGKREPDYETLLKLGEYFNCSIDYLLGSSRGVRYPLLSEFERNLLEQYHFYPRPPRGGRQQKQRQKLYFQTNYTTFCTNLEEP